MNKYLLLGIVSLAVLPSMMRAQSTATVPDSISFQGFLTDPSGVPITGTEDVTTTFYKNGIAGYTQIHANVSIDEGLFNVFIGPVDTVLFDRPIELGVKVGADPEITPRTPLVSAPYALGLRGLRTIAVEDLLMTGINVVGGPRNNVVASGAVAATISGGGGWSDGLDYGNSVLDHWGTIGGGARNVAGGRSTVAGGIINEATGGAATIGGGASNVARGSGTVIAGGLENLVTGWANTVGGGTQNEASGARGATVPGGFDNRAIGEGSFAAGHDAKALHDGAFVWNDRSVILGNDSLLSTGPNQFLIRAAGGVGIGTNAPAEQLHVIEPGGSTGIKIGGNGTSGPNGIVFEDDTDDTGVQLFWRTTGNQFVLERTSQGTGTNGTDALMYDRDDQRFVFTGSRNATATFSGHLVGFDNTAGGSADGIAIRLGASNAGGGNNFISFFDGDNDPYGRIEGNGSNGVVYETTGGDYAEYLPRLHPNEAIQKGDVVAVTNGAVTRQTDHAQRMMVITDRPAVLGNMPDPVEGALYERVAFIGQVPVKVIGPVASGDYLVPSGNSDGTTTARKPGDLRPADLDRIVGMAWESSDNPGLKKVIAEVGLDRARATRLAFENELSDLWQVIEAQQKRLATLEERIVN